MNFCKSIDKVANRQLTVFSMLLIAYVGIYRQLYWKKRDEQLPVENRNNQ
jgi:hypothetical protein